MGAKLRFRFGLGAAIVMAAATAALPVSADSGVFGDPGEATPLAPAMPLQSPSQGFSGGFSTFGPQVGTPAPGLTPPRADTASPQDDDATPPAAGDPTNGGAKTGTAVTTPAPSAAEARAKALDQLFQRLSVTTDDVEATGIVGAIERLWLQSDSATADLLMQRSLTALGKKNYDLAEQLLEQIVIIAPDWAEAWNKLATARYSAGDYPGAMEDIAHVLVLEPRHFGALEGMGSILERSGDRKGALQVYRRVLQIYPQQDDIKKLVQKLQFEVEGQPI